MSDPIRVQVPNGDIAEFPAGTPDAEIERVLKEAYGSRMGVPGPTPELQDPQNASTQAMDTLASVASGVPKGLIGATIGLPGNVAALGKAVLPEAVLSKIPPWAPHIPTGEELTPEFLDYKPKTRAGRYLQSTSEGISGAALPVAGMTWPVRLAMGAASGAGGELAGESTNSSWGRLGGASLPWAIASYLGTKKPQIVKATQSYVEDVAGKLPEAKANTAAAKAATGIDFLLTQGLSEPSSISGITKAVAASPQGGAVRRVLEKQALWGQDKIDQAISEVSKAPIGQSSANEVAEALGKAMKAPEEAVTAVTTPWYERAKKDSLSDLEVLALTTALENRRKALHMPKTSDSGQRMIQAGKDISETPGNVMDLNTLKREAATAAEAARKPGAQSADLLKMHGNQAIAGEIRDATHAASQNLTIADMLSTTGKDMLVKPVQNSALGQIATDAVRGSGVGDWGSFTSVLKESKFDAADVRDVARAIRPFNPEAFPMIVKANLEAAKEKVRGLHEGRVEVDWLGNWVDEVAGAPGSKAREKFSESMRQVALSKGATEAAAKEYANQAVSSMDILSMAARERGDVAGIAASEMRRNAGTTMTSSMLRGMGILPLWPAARALEHYTQGRVYSKLSDALVSGDIKALQDVANFTYPKSIGKYGTQAGMSISASTDQNRK